jgi:hypothetical protein
VEVVLPPLLLPPAGHAVSRRKDVLTTATATGSFVRLLTAPLSAQHEICLLPYQQGQFVV